MSDLISTWTDEEVQQHLDEWNAQIARGHGCTPDITLHAAPAKYPWLGMEYILTYKDTRVKLEPRQANVVIAWLHSLPR